MIPKSLSDWIVNCESNDVYASEWSMSKNSKKKYIYNMDVCNSLDEVYSNLWNRDFEFDVYCFAHSDYGLGTFSLLVYELSSGKIRKYLCDTGGSKTPILEFEDIQELLEYDAQNVYPSFDDIKNNYMDWKLKESHVFM